MVGTGNLLIQLHRWARRQERELHNGCVYALVGSSGRRIAGGGRFAMYLLARCRFLDTRQEVVPSGNDDVGDLNGFGE